jgi:uncharacterized protein YodC (DUF2158 family)
MAFQPGDIVALKSGSQYMTVSGVSDDGIECIWIGEEGDFFRETVPAAVLKAAESDEIAAEEDAGDEDEADLDDETGDEVRKIA